MSLTPEKSLRLLVHLDGPQPVIAGSGMRTLKALAALGLVAFDRKRHPRQSRITPEGRRLAAKITVQRPTGALMDARG